MMEFWVNSPEGLPFFFITAEVNEKMIEMLEAEIIPRLLELHPPGGREEELMASSADYPRFTLVFDREGYSPAFFKHLWDSYRIAVLTCRKNVKDELGGSLFRRGKSRNPFGRNKHVASRGAAPFVGLSPARDTQTLAQRPSNIYRYHQPYPLCCLGCRLYVWSVGTGEFLSLYETGICP
jgi:hypothetical protein